MSEFEIPIGSLEEQALKRKERLKNLKRKAVEKDASSNNTNEDASGKIILPLPIQIVTTETQNQKEAPEELKLKNDDVISKISTEVETLRTPIVIEDIDIQNLAPRKPDWDLKRDVAKKLDILDRRTQRAIAELIRDRLKTNQTDLDLQAVNAVGYAVGPSKT